MDETLDDDQLLASLGDHPGWKVLEKRFTEHRERLALNLSRRILRGDKIDLRDEQANAQMAGAAWLLRQPSDAKTRAEKVISA